MRTIRRDIQRVWYHEERVWKFIIIEITIFQYRSVISSVFLKNTIGFGSREGLKTDLRDGMA